MPWTVPPNAPVPSTANYSARNVAPLMTFFAPLVNQALGGTDYTRTDLAFLYENNTPDDDTDERYVVHPHIAGDTEYADGTVCRKSKELKAYERSAKKSKRLDDFRKKAPVVIDYFNNNGCGIINGDEAET